MSFVRKLVVVESMPEGAISYYDADIEEFYGVKVAEDGTSRFVIAKALRTTVNPFEIWAKVKVPFKELKIRKYRVFDRAKERLKQAMYLKEDLNWLALIHAAAVLTNTEVQEGTAITKADYAEAQLMIEQHRLLATSIIINPFAAKQMRNWQRDYIDEVARIELRRTGYIGNLFGMNFYVTTLIPSDDGNGYSYSYCVAPPEFLAWFPIYADAEVVPADRGDDGLLGLSCYQLNGMIVHNSYAASRVRFNASST